MHTIILVALTLCVVVNAICFVVLRRLPPQPPQPPMLRKARLAVMGLSALAGSASAAELLFRVV